MSTTISSLSTFSGVKYSASKGLWWSWIGIYICLPNIIPKGVLPEFHAEINSKQRQWYPETLPLLLFVDDMLQLYSYGSVVPLYQFISMGMIGRGDSVVVARNLVQTCITMVNKLSTMVCDMYMLHTDLGGTFCFPFWGANLQHCIFFWEFWCQGAWVDPVIMP